MKSITYTILSLGIFCIAALSLLTLQDNDIKVPQQKITVKLDLSNKFNLNLASSEDEKSLFSN